ncbi:interferon alpha-1-like [Acomys russatus]|uniref:interferon alpha-1-like n=1 Tax=Acomys russatus TaxID=60746 RepID=UPI0021E1CFB7|nr:interferon alpha-1-like [Acomys russatus]
MLPVLLLLVGGVMLGCHPACSQDWGAAWRLRLQARESARLLRELKNVTAHQCLWDRTDFRCPWKKGGIIQGKQKEVTCCSPEMLRGILQLFTTEASLAAWPERALAQLLTSLMSALDTLQEAGEQGLSCPPHLAKAIRSYFLRCSRYLKDKGYSPCSWEIVRTEMGMALSAIPLP